jgi:hypothetical protein
VACRSNPCDSFAEQRDNILACTRSFAEKLGVRPTCYHAASDMFDASTARAVEAAGIEVGTEDDATKWQKLLTFPTNIIPPLRPPRGAHAHAARAIRRTRRKSPC